MSALAHWCVRHRKTVFAGWLLLAVGLVVAVVLGGSAFKTSSQLPDSESSKAYALLAQMGNTGSASSSSSAGGSVGKVVWQSTSGSVTSDTVKSEVTSVLDQLAKTPGVESVVSPYSKAGSSQLATKVNIAYAQVNIKSDADVAPIEKVITDAKINGVTFTYGGDAFKAQISGGDGGPEIVGLLAALVLLMLMFRSWRASLLPLITGVTGVLVSLLLVMVGSHVIDLDSTSITMAAMMGLAVGIDYALFVVNRTRKGLLAGNSVPDAIARAIDTSGRAVIFAGLTVMIALLAIRVVGMGVLTGMGEATAVTVAVTVLAALTLLPAMLGSFGLKVLSKKQRTQLAQGIIPTAPTGTLAGRWVKLVQRAPWLTAPLALAAVVLLALPVLQMRVGDSDSSSDPTSSATYQYYEMSAKAFGAGFDNPLMIVASTPDAQSQQAFTTLVGKLSSVTDVVTVTKPTVSSTGTIRSVTIIPGSSSQADATATLIEDLHDKVIPAAESGTALKAYVGGSAASTQDLSDALLGKLPIYLGIIAVLGFLLLAVAFRSLLVPLVGALSNITSILVGLGVITAVFQFGWGSELLGVGSGAPITYIVPILVVGIVFGLSMDYQVFLVSRIHEEWSAHQDNRRAIRVGVTETGRVIATAALIMLGVFLSFAFDGERIVAAIGLGLGSAVFIDAFVVRMTLIPALMTMIGKPNWYYPRWAEKITPHVAIEGIPDAEPSTVAPAASDETRTIEVHAA